MSFAPGTVLACKVPVLGGVMTVTHVGIATEGYEWFSGEQTVISASKFAGRKVVEQSLSVFSGGAPVTATQLRPKLPVHEVLVRARAALGRGWDLIDSNCEHFVRWALGYEPESPQLRSGVAMGGLVLLLVATGILFTRRYTRSPGPTRRS